MTLEESFLPEAEKWSLCQCAICAPCVRREDNPRKQVMHRSRWVCRAYALWKSLPARVAGTVFIVGGWYKSHPNRPLEIDVTLTNDSRRSFSSYEAFAAFVATYDPNNPPPRQDPYNPHPADEFAIF